MFMYIQMSKEMMEYGDDGLLYYERAVSVFLPELFARWKEIGASHSLYIVLFGRSYCVDAASNERESFDGTSESDSSTLATTATTSTSTSYVSNKNRSKEDDCTLTDCYGRRYRDWYKVVVDEQGRDDWSAIISQLKREMTRFPPDCASSRNSIFEPDQDIESVQRRYSESGIGGTKGGQANDGSLTFDSFRSERRRRQARTRWTNSSASQGNFLEALNMALSVFDRHNVDRNLRRTGMDVIVISAGTGFFEVDPHLALVWVGGWWMVDGGWWMVDGGWWMVDDIQ
jgi:DEP domain-containing protein 5